MKKIIIVLSLIFLTACKTTPPIKQKPIELLVAPSIGSNHKVFMGETLITQGYGQIGEALHTVGGTYGYSVFSKGVWQLTHADKNEKKYSRYNAPGDNGVLNGYKTKLAYDRSFITLELDDNNICHYDLGVSVGCTSEFTLDKNYFFTAPRKLQQKIIYTGKSKSILNFTYREFIDDMARPSFTINFNVDIDDGKEFAFKGAVFEVISANNSGLEYKIIKEFP